MQLTDVNIDMENVANELSVVDLSRIKSIIEVACARGAFQAHEMRTVGETYEKIAAFLTFIMAEAESQQTDTSSKGD